MSGLSFGLKPSRPSAPPQRLAQKRKAAFEQAEVDSDDEDTGAFGSLSQDGNSRRHKSPKVSISTKPPTNGASLSALRSAKLQDKQASELDATVYDYDGVYDALAAQKAAAVAQKTGSTEPTVPKYMTNLLASADVRKRDQLRAKEKALQKEREAEGEEFADKEKFVTGAYKKQQEEARRIEEEEKIKEEREEDRKRMGGGMTGFHKELLRKDEERQKALEAATQAAKEQRVKGTGVENETEEERLDGNLVANLGSEGVNVILNDDGEIVDKRQLLSAGLNVAPSKPSASSPPGKSNLLSTRPYDHSKSRQAQDARMNQRERQSRMMEKQIEEIQRKADEEAEKEEKEREEKNKSRLTEEAKMGARERYLARKKAQEEEKRAKAKTKAEVG